MIPQELMDLVAQQVLTISQAFLISQYPDLVEQVVGGTLGVAEAVAEAELRMGGGGGG